MKKISLNQLSKLWLPLIGLVSLIWFLIRVVPKPSRAFYPCQRAAFPFASAFILWIIGFFSSILLFKNARLKFAFNKYYTGAGLLIAGLAIILSINNINTIAGENAGNSPQSTLELVDMNNNVPVEIDNLENTVSIVKSDKSNAFDIEAAEIETMVRNAVQLAGGLDNLIDDGMVVVLKPNLVCTFNYADNNTVSEKANGMVTDYRLIQAVVNIVRELNPNGKIYLLEGSAIGTTTENMVTVGWNKVTGIDDFIGIEQESGDWYEFDSELLSAVNLPDSISLYSDDLKPNGTREIYLNRIYFESDVLISIPVLKNHFVTGITGSVKNVGIGATPGKIYGNGESDDYPTQRWNGIDHNDINNLHKWIHDFYACRPVDFAIIDGLQGNDRGPVADGYSNFSQAQKNMKLILAGKDPIAVDAVASLVMGHDPQKVNHLVHLHNSGFGNVNSALINVVGESVESVRTKFSNYSAGLSSVFTKFKSDEYNPDSIVYTENSVIVYMTDTIDLSRMQLTYAHESFQKIRLRDFNRIEINTSSSSASDSALTILYTDKYMNTLIKNYIGTFVNPSSVNKADNQNSLLLYPNPVRQSLNLEISNSFFGKYIISVLSMSGQILMQESFCKNTQTKTSTIDCSKFDSGYYLFKIENSNFCITKRILKI